MKRQLAFIFFLTVSQLIFSQQNGNNRSSLSLTDFLTDLYDVSSLPVYASRTHSAQESTYDRTGMNNDGFEGTYSFIRRNADSSLVLFDVKGSGVINRIWTPTPSDDSLDFFIDTEAKPSFTICYRDLFSGKVYPFIAPLCANQLGGFYCYLPIPFSKSCKIIFRGKKTRFHQIGYRLFPAGTIITKFSLPLQDGQKLAIEKLKLKWNKPFFTVKDINKEGLEYSSIKRNITLRPGQVAAVFESNAAGRIIGFELSSPDNLERVSKDIDLKITWDGESTPAVYCPLADYFGYAFGKPSMKSLLIGSEAGKNYSYFPMPYDRSARIELHYRKSTGDAQQRTINFQSSVFFTAQKRDAEHEGKFYAWWRRDNPVPTGQPHTILDIKGKGHFVGTALQSQGLKTGMTIFFEGDDSTVVDGELRMHGTGSEDYFNGGWYALLDCWDAAMSLPLSGALDYSIPFCRTGGYRLFIGDKISFEKSFFQSIEHGGEFNLVPADYTSVSYFYCSRSNSQEAAPSIVNTKLYMPDTLMLYPQLLNMGIDGKVVTETRWAFPINGLTFYYTVDNDSRLRLSLAEIPPGSYRIYLDYVKDPAGAEFSIWQRQTSLTDWIDSRNTIIAREPMREMSDILITGLNNTISFRFKTTNTQNQFILNRIILVKNK